MVPLYRLHAAPPHIPTVYPHIIYMGLQYQATSVLSTHVYSAQYHSFFVLAHTVPVAT